MTPWSRTIINIRIDKKEKNNNEKNRTKEERRLLHSMDIVVRLVDMMKHALEKR